LAGWFANEASRLIGTIGDSGEDRRRRNLAEWIEGKGLANGVTVRDLTKGIRRFKGDTDGAKAALDDLVSAGFGSWQQSNTGGRPTVRFVLKYAPTTVSVPVPKNLSDGSANRVYGDGDNGNGHHNELREAFLERMAIMQHDGGMTRETAEIEARRITGYTGSAE
jgi:hypothetical protein